MRLESIGTDARGRLHAMLDEAIDEMNSAHSFLGEAHDRIRPNKVVSLLDGTERATEEWTADVDIQLRITPIQLTKAQGEEHVN